MDAVSDQRISEHFAIIAPQHPHVTLQPKPVTGNTAREPERWAYVSIVDRLPAIIRQLQKSKNLSPEQADALCNNITQNHILPKIYTGPDPEVWNDAAQGLRWLEAGWLFAEALLYRHIADLTHYFTNHIDPFYSQKMDSLKSALGSIEALESEFASVLLQQPRGQLSREHFDIALQANLWSNKSDLSKNPEGGSVGKLIHEIEHLRPWILVNDSEYVFNVATKKKDTSLSSRELHIIVDNAGLEIVTDLYLAELFLHHACFDSAIIHVKLHPTFVSDVIEPDVEHTLKFFEEHSSLAPAASRWRTLLHSGRIRIQSHLFWNHFLPFWSLESNSRDLWSQLKTAGLIVVKGDANARRLHGDLLWDFAEPVSKIVNYLPSPCVNIRTLKSETVSGLSKDQITGMSNPKWYFDGIWGMIQAFPTSQ